MLVKAKATPFLSSDVLEIDGGSGGNVDVDLLRFFDSCSRLCPHPGLLFGLRYGASRPKSELPANSSPSVATSSFRHALCVFLH